MNWMTCRAKYWRNFDGKKCQEFEKNIPTDPHLIQNRKCYCSFKIFQVFCWYLLNKYGTWLWFLKKLVVWVLFDYYLIVFSRNSLILFMNLFISRGGYKKISYIYISSWKDHHIEFYFRLKRNDECQGRASSKTRWTATVFLAPNDHSGSLIGSLPDNDNRKPKTDTTWSRIEIFREVLRSNVSGFTF